MQKNITITTIQADVDEDNSVQKPSVEPTTAGTKTAVQLQRHIKGLINRVSEHTLSGIGNQLKQLYAVNSRNGVGNRWFFFPF